MQWNMFLEMFLKGEDVEEQNDGISVGDIPILKDSLEPHPPFHLPCGTTRRKSKIKTKLALYDCDHCSLLCAVQ